MVRRLEDVVDIARRYLQQLPASEPAMVTSFDDSMVSAIPFSHDNDALQAAVKGLQPGMFTGLWDALYYGARYLEGRNQRKVLGDPRRLLAAAEAESWITA